VGLAGAARLLRVPDEAQMVALDIAEVPLKAYPKRCPAPDRRGARLPNFGDAPTL
jgi:hypothetical protein